MLAAAKDIEQHALSQGLKLNSPLPFPLKNPRTLPPMDLSVETFQCAIYYIILKYIIIYYSSQYEFLLFLFTWKNKNNASLLKRFQVAVQYSDI